MRYLRARFTGYIGFYNGMNLDVVDIDFTKCTNRIVLITGRNGSGKSTLLSHLNPFPDSSSSFVPGVNAEKFLVLADRDNIYELRLISEASATGRKTTKAFIQKNGLELNENGNVSSYKDIIFSEFELDSNYISLSSLSSNDRGLGDKTPSERKKFVSNIIENLEIYNNMYKTLNKKSLVYKSNINTLHTKIQNIGSKDLLDSRLNSLRSREADLNSKMMDYNNKIVAIQAKTSIDEEESKKIQDANDKVNSLKLQLDQIQVKIDGYSHRTKIGVDEIESKYNEDKALKIQYESKIESANETWKDKSRRLNEVNSSILSLQAELENNDYDVNIAQLYTESNEKLKSYLEAIQTSGLVCDTNDISKLEKVIEFCDKFIPNLDHFYDGLDSEKLNLLANNLVFSSVADLQNQSSQLVTEIEQKKEKLSDLQVDLKTLAILENRPKNCKINNCAFISDALKLKSKIKKDPVLEIDALQKDILSISGVLTKNQERIDFLNSLVPKSMELDKLRDMFFEIEPLLSKFEPNFQIDFNLMISQDNPFNMIRDHQRYIDTLNILKLLDNEETNNKILQVEYNAYQDKIKLINSSRKMLDNLNTEKESLMNEVSEAKNTVDSFNEIYNTLMTNLTTEEEYIHFYNQYKEIEVDYNQAMSVIEEFNKKSSKSLESIAKINEYKESIAKIADELNPVMQEISTIAGQLTLLDSYYAEYNEAKQSYDIIETIKKYCSPTGGGIQTIFMQLYMSKTMEMANRVLGMLFEGAYRLDNFVINDSEFRIPFIGEGLPVDDISSGSASQIAMMGMIINLVLLHQASTKFNIALLDELDSSLDGANRSNFVNVLFYSLDILEIEQLFIISHSLEVDNSMADVIKLRGYDDYESGIASGNIIWDYNKLINFNE